ncbi:MAG: tetratricopeptide repeat protein, partial [Desulfomonilaceae bacterium]
MKKTSSLLGMSLVFIAGVLTGIGISAWKLDLGATGVHQAQKGQENNPKEEIKGRISEMEHIMKSDPNNLQVLIQLGGDYFDTGQYDKSIQTYDKALKIDPKNAEITTDMAVAYRRLGKTDESVKLFRKAIEMDPNQTLAMFNLGIVLRDDKKDLPGALKVWKTFLDKAPDSPHAVMI